MASKSVPHGMGRDGLGNATTSPRLLTGQFYGFPVDVTARNIAGKQPRLGLHGSPPVPQGFQQLGGEHDIAVFLALALLHANDHALAIDIDGPQANGFGDTQASRVASGQDGAMLGTGDTIEEVQHLLWTEDNGQLLRLLRRRDDVFQGPIPMQGDLIEKAESGYGDENRTGGQRLFVGEVDLVSTNFFRT